MYECLDTFYEKYFVTYLSNFQPEVSFGKWIVARQLRDHMVDCISKCCEKNNMVYIEFLQKMGVDILQQLSDYEVSSELIYLA